MKRIALSVIFLAVTSLCSGQWLERQVVIGDTFGGISLTGGIVVNPVSGNVYIESDPIQVLNPVTMQKIRGLGPSGLVVFCPPTGKGFVVRETLAIIDAAADTVIGTAPLPFSPSVLAYSLTSRRLYLGSEEELLVFDPVSDSILETIEVGATVQSLLWDSLRNRLYVGTNADSGQLKVFDCVANTLLAEVELDLYDVWWLALSTVSHKLYCAGIFTGPGDGVQVVSTDSLKPGDTIPGLRIPPAVAYSPVTNRLYCVSVLNDSVFVVDCRSDAVRARFAASVLSMAASSATGRVYLGRADSAQVLVVDTNDVIARSIPLPDVPTHDVAALTYRPDRVELYGVTTGDRVFKISASADTVTGEVSYAAYLPRQMVYNPAGNKLYLICPGFDEVLVMDSAFGAPKRILRGVTGTNARSLLNPALNRLYVVDYGQLRVIDCNSDVLARSLSLEGATRALPLMVPYLNKLYIFPATGSSGDYVYAYDCLKDTAVHIFSVSDDVPCAVFDPRSNRVFFACHDAPTVRALDPATDSVVKTLDLVGGSSNGKMALNLDLGRLYYTDQSPDRMFTIDVLTDSVISSESLPWNVDTMFLDRRLGKLYMCGRSQALVFDCRLGAIVDTIDAGYRYTGIMDDRNDKLYLRYGTVVDCRYDSVVAMLTPDSISPYSMAWDAIDNRVFQATTSRLYVYRANPYGVEEHKDAVLGPSLTVLGNPVRNAVRLRLQIPHGQTGTLSVHDVTGRLIHSSSGLSTSYYRLDLRSVPAGVYFVCLEAGRTRATDKVIVQH